jgi:hypothetical protein
VQLQRGRAPCHEREGGREWEILVGENDCTTGTFGQIISRPPRAVAEFLHQYRAEFA